VIRHVYFGGGWEAKFGGQAKEKETDRRLTPLRNSSFLSGELHQGAHVQSTIITTTTTTKNLSKW